MNCLVPAALFAILAFQSDSVMATTPDRPNLCFGKVCIELSVPLEGSGLSRKIGASFSADMASEQIRIVVPGSGRIEVLTTDSANGDCESKSIQLVVLNRRRAKATGCLRYPVGEAYGSRNIEISYEGKNSAALDSLLEVVGPIWAIESSPDKTWEEGYLLRLGPAYRISQ
jgi:hypothetical protein